jgi:RND family efflux transporter MFP subunit
MSTEINKPESSDVGFPNGTENVNSPVSPALPCAPASRGSRLDWRLVSILFLAAISVPFYRLVRGNAKAEHITPNIAVAVAVAKVTREDLKQEIVCDAELRPYQEVDLHAKVAGYLQKINVDIGDRVEAGQLIAVIEVPELADDIARAEAMHKHSEEEVTRGQTAYEDTHLVYTRMLAVETSHPNLLAQQDLDTAQTKDRIAASSLAAAKDQVEVARAELNKLHTMQKYSQITAPFAGIITKRYADPGALIQAGTSSSTQARPLVRLSQNDRLRLDIPVSVSYVSAIKRGDLVEIRFNSLAAPLTGVIARSTQKVDSATRSMEVEVDVPNTNLTLIPGMYASASLSLAHRNGTLVVPIEAVSRQKTCTVFLVTPQDTIEERTISLGLETPRALEVLAGLHENDLVMIGSRTQVKPGQQVEPKLIPQTQNVE